MNGLVLTHNMDKNKIDVSQVFLLYVTLLGDTDRVAAALNIEASVVDDLAETEGWRAKLSKITLMSKGGKPGDFERAQNRAVNFVQAHKLRSIYEKVLRYFDDKDPEEVLAALQNFTKLGTTISARFLADLSSAIEKAQMLSYIALGDSITERHDRASGMSQGAGEDIHTAIIAAMNAQGLKNAPAEKLLTEASREVAEELVASARTLDAIEAER